MHALRFARLAALLPLLGACGDPSIDEYEPRTGIITGTVLYRPGPRSESPCTPSPVRGNVIVTLFAEDRPPPPTGTSGPVNFIVVPESELFAGSEPTPEGVYAAPFTIPTVAAGRYQLRAFLDADGSFKPTVDLMAQPTAGDVLGGHVDPNTGQLLTVVVENDRVTPQVTVSVGRPLPVERPAFVHGSSTTFQVPFRQPERLVLESVAIERPPLSMKPECARFLVQWVDEDGDGVPDDQNGDNLPDLYPRVLLRRIPTADRPETILIPAIINPFPFLDALAASPAGVPTDLLELILPPVAVERSAAGQTILPAIPPGEYETVVISGTGQTWQVPNRLDLDFPGGPDPTQSARVVMAEGEPLPPGTIRGQLRVETSEEASAYVFAFRAEAPPPPRGTGRPVAFTSVPRQTFQSAGAVREAPFTLAGLPEGRYLVLALYDLDQSFSPLVDLVAQPSAGDLSGAAPGLVEVGAEGVQVVLNTAVPFDRPVFAFPETTLPRSGLPGYFELAAHEVPRLGITPERARFPVTLTGEDADGDNLLDVYPRVLLTRLADDGDPRFAPDHPEPAIVPGIVDPIPFLGLLGRGAAAVPADRLGVIVPPVALRLGVGGQLERIGLPPPGRYRVHLLSATGQTWSVPSDLDRVLGRVGTPREDQNQTRVVTIEDTPIPGGTITGELQLLAAAPEGEFQVVVLAFLRSAPPPPHGSGRPLAITLVPKVAFGAGSSATYTLGGLATGTYEVRAFLDANNDFTPWFDPMNQPNRGDIGGGHLEPSGALRAVEVDALRGPTAGVAVNILEPATYATDRPSFVLPEGAVLDISTGSVSVNLTALGDVNDVYDTHGVFPVRWVDLDGNGVADDNNRDGVPDVFPLVIAERLDPDDPRGLRLAPEGARIFGIVPPSQFSPLGFPAADPTQVSATVLTSTVRVIFPAVAVTAAAPATPIAPPPGRYRVTVINPRGQTWTVPNVLGAARGTAYEATQGRALSVQP